MPSKDKSRGVRRTCGQFGKTKGEGNGADERFSATCSCPKRGCGCAIKEMDRERRLMEIKTVPEGTRQGKRPSRQYCSAEFLIDGLELPYQFRIQDISAPCLYVLVKENSDIAPRLKVGETLNVKYYSPSSSPTKGYQKTAVRHITKNDRGRLKGHYLVGLEILER